MRNHLYKMNQHDGYLGSNKIAFDLNQNVLPAVAADAAKQTGYKFNNNWRLVVTFPGGDSQPKHVDADGDTTFHTIIVPLDDPKTSGVRGGTQFNGEKAGLVYPVVFDGNTLHYGLGEPAVRRHFLMGTLGGKGKDKNA